MMNRILFRATAVACLLSGLSTLGQAQVPGNPYSYARQISIEHDPSTGLVTAEVTQPNHVQQCLRTEYTYDNFGNRRTSSQKNCAGATGNAVFNIRTLTEDHLSDGVTQAGLFPTVVANAKGQVEQFTYDSRYGLATQIRDANSLVSSVLLDEFGRKTLEIHPDLTRVSWTYSACSSFAGPDATCNTVYAAGAVLAYSVKTTPMDAAGIVNGPISTEYYDTEGRVVRSEIEMFAAGAMRTSVIVRELDGLGRLARQSGPYFEGDAISEWVQWTYDNLGRVTSEIRPNANAAGGTATETITYSGLTTTRTNSLNQTLVKEKDEYERVKRVTDAQGNQVSYQFDAFGNIAVIRDGAGNLTNFTYDFRGSKVSVSDHNMGVWIYEVDALGQLVRQTNPKAQVSTLSYDQLGRMVRRLESDLDSSWYYDTTAAGTNCGASIAQLCEATTTSGYRKLNTFDALARIVQSATTLASGADGIFLSKVSYDANGRIAQQVWPTGLGVNNGYNNRGVLTEMRDAATNALFWQRQEGNARGNVVRAALGNGAVSRTVRQADTGLVAQLQVDTAAGTAAAVNVNYSYNAITNLTGRSDIIQGLVESFGYDRLNRLTTQTLLSPTSSRSVSYWYDALGNLTYNSDVGTYSYTQPAGSGLPLPHAVKSINGQAGKLFNPQYVYDANGNIQTVTGSNGVTRNHQWTSFDQPANLALSDRTVSSAFLYGPDHQRIRQVITRDGQSRTVLYLHPDNAGGLFFERELQGTGGVATNRHFLTADRGAFLQLESPGPLQANPTPTSLVGLQPRYLHKDHLGSVVAITDGVGSVLERLAYDPFGKRRNAAGAHDKTGTIDAGTTKRGFTGHEHLDELDYIHANGRIYDPDISRFLSPDPTIPYLHHLQSLNRYSYTRNNPLNLIDPSGFDDAAAEGGDKDSKDKSTPDTPESLGNSLSKDSVAVGIKAMANANATSPADQGGTKASKPQASDPSDTVSDFAAYNKALYGIGLTFSKWGMSALSFFNDYGISPFGKATAAAAPIGFLKHKAEEMIAKKAVTSAVSEAAHSAKPGSIQSVEVIGSRIAAKASVPYSRPSGATTAAQRASVQGKPCVKCGAETEKQVAGHKKALVIEHYETGTIDKQQMRSIDAVQSECPSCSAHEGAEMSRYSREMKKALGL